MKLRRSSSPQHSLRSYLPLISFSPLRDTVLGGQPPRRLRVYLAEALRIRRTTPRITPTNRNSPRTSTAAHFNGSTLKPNSTLYCREKMLNYGKFYGTSTFPPSEHRLFRLLTYRVSMGRVRRQITTRIRCVSLRKQGHLLASQSTRQKLHNQLV